jgi:hypothetical protein
MPSRCVIRAHTYNLLITQAADVVSRQDRLGTYGFLLLLGTDDMRNLQLGNERGSELARTYTKALGPVARTPISHIDTVGRKNSG